MAISARLFFLIVLAGGGELRNLADVGRLGGLAAGVGVDLGVEDEDVDVVAGGQDVVQAAEADVVGPAVAAEDPDGLLGQVLLVRQDRLGAAAARRSPAAASIGAAASGTDGLGVVAASSSARPPRRQALGALRFSAARSMSLAAMCFQQASEARAAPPRGQAACPGRARRCPRRGSWTTQGRGLRLLTRVRRRGGRAAPDGGAAGGVGDVHAVAEQLGDQTARRLVSAQPAQAPENSSSGCLNWLPLALVSCAARACRPPWRRSSRRRPARASSLSVGTMVRASVGQALDAHAAAHAVQRGDGQGVLIARP